MENKAKCAECIWRENEVEPCCWCSERRGNSKKSCYFLTGDAGEEVKRRILDYLAEKHLQTDENEPDRGGRK